MPLNSLDDVKIVVWWLAESLRERRNSADGDKVVTHGAWLVAGARQKLVVMASCGWRFRVRRVSSNWVSVCVIVVGPLVFSRVQVVRMVARSVNGRWPWLRVNEEAALLMVVVRCELGR
ncbi:hypothetical protein LR48_Vigan123s002500 [Vigna angularis]|uniref:Uncharacterized protein n=1 Tax=Phaseolus angularis TaxID=3914 RepID=A0A0L9T4S7_PHAAN|nr:hypothetical protein LR48_Vigan123s002500 [Vigna angularis]